MSNPYAETRANIECRLILGVLRGDLDESQAKVWREAFRSLDDSEFATLMRQIRGLSYQQASALTVRFLMDRYYPFREMILYQTDDSFKRRMRLLDYIDEWEG
ncbi:MAG: hypothetical protein ONB44_03895 [candidate division KSB1 bacterium]|nr:hypothetical protein [candidate division KSB1 bacterium]MDZ7301272.1 hypothetical protein [candidate division KSB1 bacterium]MDZ7310505.1 hypothetical protein [candidate division KSB1 bacterium]